jgi:hypothetical protein
MTGGSVLVTGVLGAVKRIGANWSDRTIVSVVRMCACARRWSEMW